MKKITVIGAGNVGATIAYTLVAENLASEIVVIDIAEDKAKGEALDIQQGMPFCAPNNIIAGGYPEAAGSDAVIITSGIARKPGQTRLDLAQTNVNIIKSIIPEITRYAPDAFYVLVSNPVDVLTYTFLKNSGIPAEKIIGSGALLDTARLRVRLGEIFSVNQQNIHAYVLGEHGDSSMVPWSLATIAGVPLDDYAKAVADIGITVPEWDKGEVLDYVHKSGGTVIALKRATFYAVSLSVAHIIKALQSSQNVVLTVSTMMNGEYGIEDVCLSLPNLISQKGVGGKVMLPLNEEEIAELRKSGDSLKEIIKQIEI